MPKAAPPADRRRLGKSRRGFSGPKASSLTCRNCRDRKIRCDGSQPRCGICVAYHDECVYDKPPPMSQITSMAARIAELERLVQELRRAPVDSTSPDSGTVVVADNHGSSILHDNTEMSLSKDDVCYDTTSAVHPPETLLQESPGSSIQPSSYTVSFPFQTVLAPSSDQITFWEETALENAALYTQMPKKTVAHLLATHWTWVHGAFHFVPRAMFLRDAAVGGEYFSVLLLHVICLHSTRFTEHHLTESLLARTRLYLSQEIHKEPSIPLVQALLQFSAREFGKGSISQAWLYSGMAFRIAVDLGLFIESKRTLANYQLEDIRRTEVCRQLAWSCFLWDKVISLYLGRAPALPEPPPWDAELSMLCPETDTWRPFPQRGSESAGNADMPSHTSICFKNFCRLAVIINDILLNIYGTKRAKNIVGFVQETRQRIQTWRIESPQVLRLQSPLTQCPPPHIVTQNMLYHTTIILLLRPFRTNAICRNACREAAESIESLLLLLERAFGLSKVTYVMAYCAYTAATVVVQDCRDGLPGANEKVDTYMRALNGLRASCPGISRSIDIITRWLQQPHQPVTTGAVSTMEQEQIDDAFLGQMPTFPFHDTVSQSMDAQMEPAMFSTSSSLFDSYPKEWFDFTDDLWNQIAF